MLAQPSQGSGLDPTGFDISVRPQDDLCDFVNARWLASTAIRAEVFRLTPGDKLYRAPIDRERIS